MRARTQHDADCVPWKWARGCTMRPVAKAHGASGLAEQPDTFIVIFLPPFDSFFLLFGNSFIGPRRASNKLIDSRWPSHRPLARALARPLLERNAYRQRNNNKQRARESSRLLSHYTTAVALDSATLSLHLLLFFASSLFVVPNWLVNYMGKSFCMRARHKAPGFFFLLTLSMFLCYLP